MFTATKTLREILEEKGSHFVKKDWPYFSNLAVDDIIERFDDCPEGLQDFCRSDWVNLCECYTKDLLSRWDQQSVDIKCLFDSYCDAFGYTTTLEALEHWSPEISDGDDVNAAIVNMAMTFAAQEICREVYPDL